MIISRNRNLIEFFYILLEILDKLWKSISNIEIDCKIQLLLKVIRWKDFTMSTIQIIKYPAYFCFISISQFSFWSRNVRVKVAHFWVTKWSSSSFRGFASYDFTFCWWILMNFRLEIKCRKTAAKMIQFYQRRSKNWVIIQWTFFQMWFFTFHFFVSNVLYNTHCSKSPYFVQKFIF